MKTKLLLQKLKLFAHILISWLNKQRSFMGQCIAENKNICCLYLLTLVLLFSHPLSIFSMAVKFLITNKVVYFTHAVKIFQIFSVFLVKTEQYP